MKGKYFKILITVILLLAACDRNEKHQSHKQKNSVLKTENLENKLLLECEKDNGIIKKKSEVLDSLCQIITQGNASESLKASYFETFPNCWHEFKLIFGYEGSSPNYEDGFLTGNAYSHINNCFIETKNIVGDSLFVNKVVNISLNAVWQPDGVNEFKHFCLRKIIVEDLDLLINILKRFSENEIIGFWTFYFDNPTPVQNIPENLKILKSLNQNIYNLMLIGHKRVLKKW
jgi:hypothetical protein